MTRDTVALVAFVLFAIGWFSRRLWQSNDDVKSLKRRLGNARKARWRALGLAAFVGFVLVGMFIHWMHVNGG